MNNQPHVFACASMTGTDHSFVHQDGVCSAGDDFAYGLAHIGQTFDRADRNTVVHWNNDRFTGIAVDYSFKPYFFAYHILCLQLFVIESAANQYHICYQFYLSTFYRVKSNANSRKRKKKTYI